MKKLLMICGLMLGVAGFANAQQQGGGRGMGRMGMMKPEDRVKQMDEKLKLSDDQKAKLTTLFTEQADGMKKWRETAKDGQRPDMEAIKKMREDNEAKVNAILTADQQASYKTWQDEQRVKMRERAKERKDN